MWADALPVTGAMKAVAFALAVRADDSGRTVARQAILARAAGVTDRTVRKALGNLQSDGHISTDKTDGIAYVLSMSPQEKPELTSALPVVSSGLSRKAEHASEKPEPSSDQRKTLPSPLPAPSPSPSFPPVPPLTTPSTSPPITPSIAASPAGTGANGSQRQQKRAPASGSDLFGAPEPTAPASKPKPAPGERGSGRKVQVPENWRPDAAGLKFAADRSIDAKVEVSRFVDNHRSKGNTFVDIAAAWRTWCNSPYPKAMVNGHNGMNGNAKPNLRQAAYDAIMGFDSTAPPPQADHDYIDLERGDYADA